MQFSTLGDNVQVSKTSQSFQKSCQVLALGASWLHQAPHGSCLIFRDDFSCMLILNVWPFCLYWAIITVCSSVRGWVNAHTWAACTDWWHKLGDGVYLLLLLSDDTLYLGCPQWNLCPTASISLVSLAISSSHCLICCVLSQQHSFSFEVLTAFLEPK